VEQEEIMATKKDQKNDQIEVTPREEVTAQDSERTRAQRCFIPRADIYETDKEIVVVAEIPGADQKSVDVVVEKNVLTINAYVEALLPEGYGLSYAEYEQGDYQRSFRLPDEIDRDAIKATVSEGELRLTLPKAEAAKSRKIKVVAT
jgi:HSP20 family molecular chaperone IbpA